MDTHHIISTFQTSLALLSSFLKMVFLFLRNEWIKYKKKCGFKTYLREKKKKEKNKNGLQTIWKIVFFLDGIG